MQEYEKLGAFYLGKRYDPKDGVTDELVMYDAKDLTTHAVCVGMTGSGKTGLCLSLLEEAAIDGIPTIAIDPKGDIGNLLLTFPDLLPSDFEPWIAADDAARKGRTMAEHASSVADLWRTGLADWGQDGERIRRMRETAEFAIYTPGSSAGRPISLLQSLKAPPPVLADDADAMRERVLSTVSGLLTLVGIKPDPVRSREHILLATLIDRAWREGKDLEMAELIRLIQKPPFERIGVIDLDTFYPAEERFGLAMTLNNLLASPGFAAWLEGEPLDAQSLLWTEDGRPRVSILSIAHLSDTERMFFVTMLLDEIVSWVRSQKGSTTLRAILYMDEVFGFFPPVANPPSKQPMLTLLKQARAFGLGVVLATQNPVDLDYKGLSNAGTWFLGRLQTERDKLRVLDGLESAAAGAGGFDRKSADEALSGLPGRVFLLHNVHEDGPVLMHTRWAMSYLRGPLTRTEIKRLVEPVHTADGASAEGTKPAARPAVSGAPPARASGADMERPLVPAGITERFADQRLAAKGNLHYEPCVLGRVRVHFVDSRRGLDEWRDVSILGAVGYTPAKTWEEAVRLDQDLALSPEPTAGIGFGELPAASARASTFKALEKSLAAWAYRTERLTLWKCDALKARSEAGETEGQFRIRLTQLAHEERDLAVEKLRKKYATRLQGIERKLQTAEQRVARERTQYDQQKLQTAISFGATMLGAVFGRKLASVGNIGRATTAARGAGRVTREREDVARASDSVENLLAERDQLQREVEAETNALRAQLDPAALTIEPVEITPRKADISAVPPTLVWVPTGQDEAGFNRRLT